METSAVMQQKKSILAESTRNAIRDLDSYWATIDAAREAHGYAALVEKPAGGITAQEYAERYRLNIHTAREQLRKMEAAGAVKRVQVMLPDPRGRVGATAVFVPTEAA